MIFKNIDIDYTFSVKYITLEHATFQIEGLTLCVIIILSREIFRMTVYVKFVRKGNEHEKGTTH